MKLSRVLRHALLASALTTGLVAADSDLAALRAKAEKGNAIAQYNLGLAYSEGHDTPVDRVEAYVWLSLALENGARGRALDTLTAQLSATELDAAKARLAERRAALGKPAPVAAAPTAPAAPATEPASLERELTQAKADKQQLSAELAVAWKEADQLKTELEKTKAAATPSPDAEQLRRERDALSAKITELAGDIAMLRTDRERLQKLAAQAQKDSSEARDASRAYQEQARISEMRVGELVRQSELLKSEIARADDAIKTLQAEAPKNNSDAEPLAQKTRELAATKTELENARATAAQLNAALEKATHDRTGLEQMLTQAQNAALEFGKQIDSLNHQLAAANARPSAPAYPDERERVRELEAQVTALRNAPPAYPDQRERVSELEAQVAALRNAPPAYPDLREQVTQLQTQLAQANARPAAPSYPDLRERTATLETQLAEANRRADSLDARVTQFANAKTSLDNDLATVRAQLTRSQQQSAANQDEADKLRASNQTLREQLTAAEKRPAAPEYPDLRAKVAELEQQLARTQNAAPAYPDQRERVSELEAQVAALRNAPPAYPDLREQVAQLQTQLAQANARPAAPTYPDLRERTTALETQLAEANRRADALDARVTTLTNTKTGLDNDLSTVRAQLSRSQQQADIAQEKADKLAFANRTLQEQLGAANNRAATPSYPDLREKVAQLEQQLAAAPAYPDLRPRVSELEAQVAALRNAPPAYPDLREQVTQLQTQLAQANARPAAPNYPDLRDQVSDLQRQLAAAKNAPAQYPDLRERVAQLTQELASRPSAPAYPDLRTRVAELERQLASAPRSTPPTYPDLSSRVAQLESALATTRAQLADAQQQTPASSSGTGDSEQLKQKLAEAEDKLATALTGYSQLQKDYDALQANTAKATGTLSTEKEALTSRLAAAEDTARNAQAEVARLNDALATTQRGSSQAGTELASTRALLQQLQGTNTVLAQENYQLKAALANNPTARSAAVTAAAANVRTHTVADGDSLSKISQRYYGSPSRWQEIYAANRELIGPQGQLRIGQVLRIP